MAFTGDDMKNGEKKTTAGKGSCCPSCGLPVTDPLWFNCPRCRASLSMCSGCEACGKCGKEKGMR